MFTLTRSSARSFAQQTATTSPPQTHIRRAKRGRMLVECLVAMLLLAVTGQLVVALAQGIARSADSARLTNTAWAMATVAIESKIAAECSGSGPSGDQSRPRVTLTSTERAAGSVRESDISVRLARSPLAHSTEQTLRLSSARSCP